MHQILCGCMLQGVLGQVVPQVHQVFERLPGASPASDADARFERFRSQVWPRIREAGASGAQHRHLPYLLLQAGTPTCHGVGEAFSSSVVRKHSIQRCSMPAPPPKSSSIIFAGVHDAGYSS